MEISELVVVLKGAVNFTWDSSSNNNNQKCKQYNTEPKGSQHLFSTQMSTTHCVLSLVQTIYSLEKKTLKFVEHHYEHNIY